jgi:hypothetical protein
VDTIDAVRQQAHGGHVILVAPRTRRDSPTG